jgi:hypothetical protein
MPPRREEQRKSLQMPPQCRFHPDRPIHHEEIQPDFRHVAGIPHRRCLRLPEIVAAAETAHDSRHSVSHWIIHLRHGQMMRRPRHFVNRLRPPRTRLYLLQMKFSEKPSFLLVIANPVS